MKLNIISLLVSDNLISQISKVNSDFHPSYVSLFRVPFMGSGPKAKCYHVSNFVTEA
jgi:hypothetical protein